MKAIGIVQYGVSYIGSEITKLALSKGMRVVGAIDVDRKKAGRDLGHIVGLGKALGVRVSDDEEPLVNIKADVALHATTSLLQDVYPQIAGCIKRGFNVISTCEELAYPYIKHPELANKIDALAKRHGVTVLGTGVNPGFVMDTLVIALTGICKEVRRIKVTRVVDVAKRRPSFQKKMGIGLTVEEFERSIKGHVGLTESIGIVADALGWRLDRVEEKTPKPIVANTFLKASSISVQKGQVAGLRQLAIGIKEGEEAITLEFKAHMNAQEEYDEVIIDGEPSFKARVTPCVHGDVATAAMVVNSIPHVVNAEPGLKTMKDLPLPSHLCWQG